MGRFLWLGRQTQPGNLSITTFASARKTCLCSVTVWMSFCATPMAWNTSLLTIGWDLRPQAVECLILRATLLLKTSLKGNLTAFSEPVSCPWQAVPFCRRHFRGPFWCRRCQLPCACQDLLTKWKFAVGWQLRTNPPLVVTCHLDCWAGDYRRDLVTRGGLC